jgi:hypothetical protein
MTGKVREDDPVPERWVIAEVNGVIPGFDHEISKDEVGFCFAYPAIVRLEGTELVDRPEAKQLCIRIITRAVKT